MKYVFKISNLNYVEADGLPNDEELCFVVWADKEGNLDCFVGSYDENKKQFYADYGMGGVIVKAKSVIAWKLFDADNIIIGIDKD